MERLRASRKWSLGLVFEMKSMWTGNLSYIKIELVKLKKRIAWYCMGEEEADKDTVIVDILDQF